MPRRGCGALDHNRQSAAKTHTEEERIPDRTERNLSSKLQCQRTFRDYRVAGGLDSKSPTGRRKPFCFLSSGTRATTRTLFGTKMTQKYSQRSLIVLSLLGILSAIMTVLSVILIFQQQSQQKAVKESPPSTSSVIPAHVWAVLLPVSTVLSALSLTLNLSSVVVCLLHSYFSTEVCRGEQDTDRADWFLLDSRAVRHVAIGLFCLGVTVYLAAMSIFMLLIFEMETGIASACVLSSGILILLVAVIHSLVKASRAAKHYHSDRVDTLYQNDHRSNSTAASRPCELRVGVDKPQIHRSQSHLQHPISYPPCGNLRQREPYHQQHQQQYSPAEGSQGHSSDKDGCSSGGSYPRMHRTLSTESGLLQAQVKPWNGVNNEMRSVLARKSGISAKDSTLV
ncbi:transmembrane protein 221 isoform 2-T2 [Odontesthes bonariensis]|uniref:transmembrane protein 221 isoform X2 n=1 Tax=Odontesthes bonariensis TaxID=219752 RepID=UPI003F58243B